MTIGDGARYTVLMSENENPEVDAGLVEAEPWDVTCKNLAKRLVKARKSEAEVWIAAKEAMRDAHVNGGLTYAEIADIFGFTKARVYQIVTGKRGGGKNVAALAEAS